MMSHNTCSTPYNPLTRTNHPTGIQTMMWKDRILGHEAVIEPYSAFDCQILAERKRAEAGIFAKAKRAATALEQVEIEPGALALVKGAVWDKYPANFPAWEMLDELFDRIAALPGSALAFRYLLVNAAHFRSQVLSEQKVFPNPGLDVLQLKLDGMVERLASAVMAELEAYASGENSGRGSRPADIYRRYGQALRYAVEELGSFRAKDALNELMCATTLPIDELENPAWIDPYTGDGEKEYEIIHVRANEAELSSDGNLPATLADLMESLGEEGSNQFQANLERLGMSTNDYWRQFIEAQRSGYSPLPEPEDEREEAEFDVIEKDFTGQNDLRVDQDEYLMVYQAVGWEVREIQTIIRETAEAVSQEGDSFDWKATRARFLADKNVKNLFAKLSALSGRHHPKDVMAVLLPLQNGFGLHEYDLNRIKVSPELGYNLGNWYQTYGDEYLEQYLNKGGPGIYASSDPDPKELEEWTEDVVADRIRTYKSRNGAKIWRLVYRDHTGSRAEKIAAADLWFEWIYASERQAEIARIQALKLKPNVRNNPEFIDAEVAASIMGDGGADGPQQAGWDAWRNGLDPEANAAFKKEYASLRNQGVSQKEAAKAAMEVFKRELARNKNRILAIQSNGKGLRLRSGRDIDWGIVRLKLDNDEIPTSVEELTRILKVMETRRFAPWFQSYLRGRIQKLEVAA